MGKNGVNAPQNPVLRHPVAQVPREKLTCAKQGKYLCQTKQGEYLRQDNRIPEAKTLLVVTGVGDCRKGERVGQGFGEMEGFDYLAFP